MKLNAGMNNHAIDQEEMHMNAPFSLLMPSLFTDKGNEYRVQVLKYGAIFILICTSPWIIMFIANL